MSQCPTENTFAEFLEGRLGDAARAGFDEHVRGCAQCEATLTALLGGDPSARSDSRSSPHEHGSESVPSGNGPSLLWPTCSVVAGRYSTQKVIGVGGMGVVYLALDTKLQRRVALKVTRSELARANALRLYREAQAMAQLSHRNVVAVHDVGMWRDHVFLAMEYLEGGTLGRYLLAHELGWSEILERFIEAGRGLAAAHEVGVVHRDFKPDNVLLGASGEAKVADFGLACVPGTAAEVTSGGPHASNVEPHDALRAHLTRLGTVLGTPGYMAPEQVRGEHVDHRADIWSYSAALYEAIYCELPFPGRTPREVLKYAEAGSFRRAPTGTRVPHWLRKALLAGLHADPSRRIATMQGLLDLLERRTSARTLGRRRIALVAGLASALAGIATLGLRDRQLGSRGSANASPSPSVTAPAALRAAGAAAASKSARFAGGPSASRNQPGAADLLVTPTQGAALSEPDVGFRAGSPQESSKRRRSFRDAEPPFERAPTGAGAVSAASFGVRAPGSGREAAQQSSTRAFPLPPAESASGHATPATEPHDANGAARPGPSSVHEAPIILD